MKALAVISAPQPMAARRRVAGLTLLTRVVRTATAAGHEVVVTGPDASVMDALDAGAQARFVEAGALDALLNESSRPVTHWTAHFVYDRQNPAVAPIDASSDAGAAAATEALWQSCRKPIDGFVSRNLNRYISLALSRRIVDTAITPNHVSALCIGLGVMSGVLAAQGGYAYLLAGAALFKLNSILDGVDGELARVRWAYSKFGELLDSAGDNIANFSFFGGITIAAHRAGQADLATAGFVGLSLWALYLVFLYSRLSGSGRGDVMTVRTNLDNLRSPLVQGILSLGRKTLRRDSFVMASFLAAVFGYAPYLLLMILVGGSTVFAYAVLHFAARKLQPATAHVDMEVDSR